MAGKETRMRQMLGIYLVAAILAIPLSVAMTSSAVAGPIFEHPPKLSIGASASGAASGENNRISGAISSALSGTVELAPLKKPIRDGVRCLGCLLLELSQP